MTTPANHWKLGLFVVVGALLALVSVLSFSAYRLRRETVKYKTYFDETVQGLEIGAPVKFRGVVIGAVSDIAVGPDSRHVEVTSSLTVKELTRLRLTPVGKRARLGVPPDLRAQLAAVGITGIKFVQIDYFDVRTNPPPVLPFPVGDDYLPAATSTLKNLEDAIVSAVDQFPVMAERLLAVMEHVERILEQVEARKLPDQASASLARVDALVVALDDSLKRLDAGKLSKQAQQAIASLNVALARLSQMMDRVGGDKGLMASAQRASDAMGDAARGAASIGGELQDALRGVHDAADSIARLSDAIERDPDMLLKGRAKRTRK